MFVILAKDDDWVKIEIFARSNEQLLKKYITLENGVPSHDTMVMSCINEQVFQQLIVLWNEMLNRNESEKLKKFYVLMEKLCMVIGINLKKLYMLFLLGQEKKVYILVKNQLMEKVRRHLDVTFREDKNKTLEKTTTKNLNIIRKWSLLILKILEMKKQYSLKKKRFAISCNFSNYIEALMSL